MRMTNFVLKVSQELETILAKPEQINHDPNHYIHLISQRVLDSLRKLLAIYSQAEFDADEKSLLPFIQWLKKTWHKDLKDSDAVFFHNRKTHVNQIITYLSNLVGHITNYDPYQLQFSGLKIQFDGELDRMLISDDDRTLIDPVRCLEAAQTSADKRLRHTHPLPGQSEFLTPAECNRVKNYTAKAPRFYHDIEMGASLHALDKSHNNLRKSIGLTVASSYGEAGVARLRQRLYGGISHCAHLIKAMLLLPKSTWDIFLANYPINQLQQIVFHPSYRFVPNKANEDERVAYAYLQKIIFNNHSAAIQNQQELIDVLAQFPRAEWKPFLSQIKLNHLIQVVKNGEPLLSTTAKFNDSNSTINEHALLSLSKEVSRRLFESVKDKNTLISALQQLPAQDWPIFVSQFQMDDLCNWLLDGEFTQERLISVFENPETYLLSMSYNTPVCFLFLELYRRDLQARPNDYNTFWGWASGYGSPKSAKEKVSFVAMKLIADGTPLNTLKIKLLEVLNSDTLLSEIFGKKIALDMPERKALIKATDGGTFGALLKQIELICRPVFHLAKVDMSLRRH